MFGEYRAIETKSYKKGRVVNQHLRPPLAASSVTVLMGRLFQK